VFDEYMHGKNVPLLIKVALGRVSMEDIIMTNHMILVVEYAHELNVPLADSIKNHIKMRLLDTIFMYSYESAIDHTPIVADELTTEDMLLLAEYTPQFMKTIMKNDYLRTHIELTDEVYVRPSPKKILSVVDFTIKDSNKWIPTLNLEDLKTMDLNKYKDILKKAIAFENKIKQPGSTTVSLGGELFVGHSPTKNIDDIIDALKLL
jgi:hypothetical protein